MDDLVTITHAASGTTAAVLPRRGFNCVSFQVLHDGATLEILWTAKDFVSGQARPASSGIPLLFPFPGRLNGARLDFGGKRFELKPEDALGNAIHGFVLSRAWRVIEQSATRVVGRFAASQDAPELLAHWPADFEITATYVVGERQLGLLVEVLNIGDGPLPFGLGMHPYFRVPIGGSDAGACRITVPVRECWELQDILPTGKLTAATDAGLSPEGVLFSAAKFDHVFTGVETAQGRAAATVADPGSGLTTRLTFDAAFRECVVYTPPHREAICIEPYTCAPDAYGLQTSGHDGGLRLLLPGESFKAGIGVEVVE